MMNKFLVLITLLIFTAPAGAQFKRKEPAPVPQSPSLECAIIRATDHDRRDPIYKITVSITLDESGTFRRCWFSTPPQAELLMSDQNSTPRLTFGRRRDETNGIGAGVVGIHHAWRTVAYCG